jgi:hypothetical protein
MGFESGRQPQFHGVAVGCWHLAHMAPRPEVHAQPIQRTRPSRQSRKFLLLAKVQGMEIAGGASAKIYSLSKIHQTGCTHGILERLFVTRMQCAPIPSVSFPKRTATNFACSRPWLAFVDIDVYEAMEHCRGAPYSFDLSHSSWSPHHFWRSDD